MARRAPVTVIYPSEAVDSPAVMAARYAEKPEAEDENLDTVEPAAYGVDHWRGLDNVAAPHQQTGVWGARMLTQCPGRVSGAQRGCVAGTLFPGWTVGSGRLGPDIWRAQQPAHYSGAQRKSRNPQQGPLSPSVTQTRWLVTGAAQNQAAAAVYAQMQAWGGR